MWVSKNNDEVKLLKDFGCFVGSFWNPEAARKIQNKDGSTNVEIDDEQFEKTGNYLEKLVEEEFKKKTKKNKKKLII